MSNVQRSTVPVTTAADGTATEYSERLNGLLSTIEYAKTDFADGVDFTITEEDTGKVLWSESNVNASAVRAPLQPAYGQTGAALTYDGTYVVSVPIAIAGRVKIAIAQGGATKTGTFYITTY